ncbi:MAG: hypothetical protein HY763_01765 [Planctomycetes bacterium]|nr:hypothetical protein [Planctomycetota bacterium]
MGAINTFLINAGLALRWLGAEVLALLVAVWAVLDAVLNPVLSPLMAVGNAIGNVLGRIVHSILSPLPVWVGLTAVSAAAGVVMLVGFRHTSNQAAIGRAKDAIKANLLALKLYKDELRVTFLAQWRLLGAVARLQLHMLKPILIMLLPMLLLLGQMGVRYQWRPLRPGERALVKVRLKQDVPQAADASLIAGDVVETEVGPVPGGGEVAWRILAKQAGRHAMKITIGGQSLEKELVIGDGLQVVSALRSDARWTQQVLHPLEPRIPADSPIASVEVTYPPRGSWFDGSDWWVLTFFVISMIAAIILAPVFKVRF